MWGWCLTNRKAPAQGFYVGLSALGFGGPITQGFALGWDMAAPLALSLVAVKSPLTILRIEIS